MDELGKNWVLTVVLIFAIIRVRVQAFSLKVVDRIVRILKVKKWNGSPGLAFSARPIRRFRGHIDWGVPAGPLRFRSRKGFFFQV
jgi:hypothetical protein